MGEVALSAAYALPLAMLIWLWLAANIDRRVKLLASALLPLFYWLQWQGIQAQRGWPAHEPLPMEFQLLAADIVEPLQDQDDKGAIHLWVRPLNETLPRVFGLPYSRALHTTLHESKQRMEQGHRQMGLLRDIIDSTSGGVAINGRQRLEFRDAPRRVLPPKY